MAYVIEELLRDPKQNLSKLATKVTQRLERTERVRRERYEALGRKPPEPGTLRKPVGLGK